MLRSLVQASARVPYRLPTCTLHLSTTAAASHDREITRLQVVGQKRAYFLAVREPAAGERYLKLTERSGGRPRVYVSVNLSDLPEFAGALRAAAGGEQATLTLGQERIKVEKVDSLDSYNFAIKVTKTGRAGRAMLFIDELQLERIVRIMVNFSTKHAVKKPGPELE